MRKRKCSKVLKESGGQAYLGPTNSELPRGDIHPDLSYIVRLLHNLSKLARDIIVLVRLVNAQAPLFVGLV